MTENTLQDEEILCPFCGEAATDGTCLKAAAERIAELERESVDGFVQYLREKEEQYISDIDHVTIDFNRFPWDRIVARYRAVLTATDKD